MPMTHKQFRAARKRLGLTVKQMSAMLSVSMTQIHRIERIPGRDSHRAVTGTMERLINAYLDGYRPQDWPAAKQRTSTQGE